MTVSVFSEIVEGPWSLLELLPDDHDTTLERRLKELDEATKKFEQRRAALVAMTPNAGVSDRPAIEGRPDTGLGAQGSSSSDRALPNAASAAAEPHDLTALAHQVLESVRQYEELVELASRLASYGELSFAADTRSQKAIAFRNRLRQKTTELENRSLYFGLWWQGLAVGPAERVLEWIGRQNATQDQIRYLEELRRLAPFRLEERSEQIVNLKDADGIGGILTLYSMLTNGFEFRPAIEGACPEGRGLTRDELGTYVHSPQPEERAASYRELFRVYGESSTVLAQMYVHRVRDWHNENVELRGYPSAISVRNVANDIPDQAVRTLLEVVREKAPLFRRYFERKAAWLGIDRLRRFDVYAPLASSSERLTYRDGVSLVLDTFSDFHPRLGDLAAQVFERDHVDSQPRPGKKGGAFCATISPSLVPWVLVNYSGRPRDVATLAHELGHAVHSLLAADHTILTQQPSLPMAETASVFAEILVTSRLLARATEPLVRRELIATALDDIYATVLRQAYFVLFEIEAHAAIVEGCTPDRLDEIYLANLSEQFGDSVEVSPEFAREWQVIPHIYSTPFYCYAYSFGQLLVLALYQRFLEENDSFKPGYLKLLAYGGAAAPEKVLAEAGIDITDADFWRGGFSFVESLLDQLEELPTS